jgi:hypothetical protein
VGYFQLFVQFISLSLPSKERGASLPIRFTLPMFHRIPLIKRTIAIRLKYILLPLRATIFIFRHLRAGRQFIFGSYSAVLFCDSIFFSPPYNIFMYITAYLLHGAESFLRS